MRLTIIGCGDAFGTGGRLQTSFFIRPARGKAFLVDCGASTLIGMHRLGIQPNEIGMVCVTHLHGDHFGGLPWLLIDAQYVSKRTEPLVVTGPKGIAARFAAAAEALYPDCTKNCTDVALQFVEYEQGTPLKLGDLEIMAFEVKHPSGAPPYALRITADGKTVGFTGDSGWTDGICAASQGSDLFISECFQYDVTLPIHLDYRTIDANYDKLGAKRVLLTHMGQEMLAAVGKVDRTRYLVAEDGMTLDL